MRRQPWIAEQLSRYPILLDELLTPETLYTPADKARLADELRQTLNRLPEDDEEAQLEALRVLNTPKRYTWRRLISLARDI
ncbi:hypothetical protein HORIV_56010 [Vreelandella olivaria]|uniref:Glutamate-ammonia ligase adenylyltransferase repeated domain-containing protein n=1 Tax=Vreelandella olivaria TaxID=390919 RepID=A0ABN5X840_9GAMM|nr:hypothetical protein HORIV_56010 [Halomonas olivaria]